MIKITGCKINKHQLSIGKKIEMEHKCSFKKKLTGKLHERVEKDKL